MREAVPHIRGRVLDFGSGAGELAEHVAPENYTGYEIDPAGLAESRRFHPHHVFGSELPPPDQRFDTIVLLAVIEHIQDPLAALRDLRERLGSGGRIVLTTMSPACRRIHEVGAKLGLFSPEAAHEHMALLDRHTLTRMAAELGLSLPLYRRFLLGGNQLAVMASAKEAL